MNDFDQVHINYGRMLGFIETLADPGNWQDDTHFFGDDPSYIQLRCADLLNRINGVNETPANNKEIKILKQELYQLRAINELRKKRAGHLRRSRHYWREAMLRLIDSIQENCIDGTFKSTYASRDAIIECIAYAREKVDKIVVQDDADRKDL